MTINELGVVGAMALLFIAVTYSLSLAYFPWWRYRIYKEGKLYFESEKMGYYPCKDILHEVLLKGRGEVGHVVNVRKNKVVYVVNSDQVYAKLTFPW